MKKGTGIGIGIAVVIVSIIVGIASLPDEVLIESPSFDTSEGQAPEEKKIVVPSESIISIEETEPEEAPPVEQVEETVPEEEPTVEQVEETVPEGEETEGKVIEVKIKDGVGTQEK